ncbi:hypothetical protein GW17_00016702 [Ensete ventricosum]|nr:hypothetical protein GW17_00016702 [Ensete ventricosum]
MAMPDRQTSLFGGAISCRLIFRDRTPHGLRYRCFVPLRGALAPMAVLSKDVGDGGRKRTRQGRRDADGGARAAREERQGAARDPLVVLGPDVMTKILEFADARSVARCTVVSRSWHEIAASDRLWAPKMFLFQYAKLLQGKAHIPRLSNLRGASRLAAYSMSVVDGKRVSDCLQIGYFIRIMKEDLCDHVWEFRYKKNDGCLLIELIGWNCCGYHLSLFLLFTCLFWQAAPEYWRDLDPSWKGSSPPMHRYFHLNGSHTADHDDKVWGGHECTYSIMTSYVGEGQIRDHYVRINRWPAMTVSRKEDWRWEMSNHLYCYISVPDAEKEGGTGPLFPAW